MGKTLITGGTGLVGSQLNGIKVSSKDCDLRKKKQVDKLFDKVAPTHVIHCAAKVGGIGANIKYKGEFFYDNIMMNTNVIESARTHGVQNLVCFLSTCVFPDKVEYPLTEQKIHLGPPHSSNNAYAYAKRMADVQIRAYNEQYGLNYVSVIPTNIYGPNDLFSIENGHVLPALIHKCYLAKKNRTDFVVWGSGKPLREFIYSKDVAKITEWALHNYKDPEPLILSTSEEISIREIVELVVDYMDFKGNLIWDSSKPDGQFRKPSSNAKLKSLLPNFNFTPLEIGLRETVEWFQKNYADSRK